MHFGNFREYSVKIGNDKKLCMPSGKRRLHSVCGRHNDDRQRNAPDAFRKAYTAFYHVRSLPSYTRTSHGNCRSTWSPVTLTQEARVYRVSQKKWHPTLILHKSSSTQWSHMVLIALFRANVSTYVCKVLAQNNEYILRYYFWT